MKKKIKLFIIFLILFGSLLFFIPFKNNNCANQKRFNNLDLNGVVITKMLDHSQHSVPIVLIKSFNDNLIDTLDFFGDKSNVFNLIKKSDTILKSKNDNKIYLKRNGIFKLLGKIDFGCEDKKQ